MLIINTPQLVNVIYDNEKKPQQGFNSSQGGHNNNNSGHNTNGQQRINNGTSLSRR